MNKNFVLFLLLYPAFFLFISNGLSGQEFDIGQWVSHLSYRKVKFTDAHEQYIYAATTNGFFQYNIESGEYTTYSTVEGLSDVGISAMKYNSEQEFLMIGYKSGLVDFVYNDEIMTLPDIEQNNSLNSKAINNIHFAGDTAFLACDFGIVLVNISAREIQSAFFLGTSEESVITADVATDADSIWVATNHGIYYAARQGTNLHNYQNWNTLETFPQGAEQYIFCETIGDSLFVAREITDSSAVIYKYKNGNYTVFRNSSFGEISRLEKRGDYYTLIGSYKTYFFNKSGREIANYYFNGYNNSWNKTIDAVYNTHHFFTDTRYGLVMFKSGEQHLLVPNSPFSNSTNQIVTSRGKILVTGGSPGTKWSNLGMYQYTDRWYNFNNRTTEGLESIPNLNYAAFDPGNNSRVMATSFGYGVVEIIDTSVINFYNQENSTLATYQNMGGSYVNTTGIAFDNNRDVWVTLNGVTAPLNLYKNNGEWESFSLNGSISNIFTNSLIKTNWGDLWFAEAGYGIVAFNPEKLKNGEISEGYKRFRVVGSDQSVLSNNITTMAVDKNNYIWMGLGNGGIAVYYNPASVLDYDIQASKIIVEQDGIANYLLENVSISAIAVDAGNRKWIGTKTNGAYLISEDGTEQILNLNTDNTPLFSNTINDIGIDNEKGWIYFATDEGIISYYSGITEAKNTAMKPKIYPNPIRENYHGLIRIMGLQDRMKVKIADIAGNIVFETMSEGGSARWNMRDFNNERVSTGVYVIFAASLDGAETTTAKLFIVSQ